MAIGVYFSPKEMSAAKYDECINLLRKAGVGHPTGRVYHACFGSSTNLSVFDVWTSQAAFDKFGKTLMPIMQQIGIDAGQPQVVPIHKVITRPQRYSSEKALVVQIRGSSHRKKEAVASPRIKRPDVRVEVVATFESVR